MNIDIERIDPVVVSHEHFDHTGGVWDLFKTRENIIIHECLQFTEEFKRSVQAFGSRFINRAPLGKITEGIYTTGEIIVHDWHTALVEQALCIGNNRKTSIITGCANYGIDKLVNNVSNDIADSIDLVMGGFHIIEHLPLSIP